MTFHVELEQLTAELCNDSEFEALKKVFVPDFSYYALIEFDYIIGGPGIATIQAARLTIEDLADRPIFRPLQYCNWYFRDCKVVLGYGEF